MTFKPWMKNVALVTVILLGMCCLSLSGLTGVIESAAQMQTGNNLKTMISAMHSYTDKKGVWPPAVIRDKKGVALYSWRVALLSFMEEEGLYNEFKLDEPWDSPHNIKLLDRMPNLYQMPGRKNTDGLTYYQVLVGPGTAFEKERMTLADFPKGLGRTILIVEAAEPVPWTKPADLEYHPDRPLPLFSRHFFISRRFLGYPYSRTPVFNVAFGDGMLRTLRHDIDEDVLRALITRNGGEEINLDALK